MAGIAFWGGFASGMSKSIERNRDRKMKQDQIKEANKQAVNKTVADNKKKQFELSNKTRDAFAEINNRIADIKSGKIGLSEHEAINEVNYLNSTKLDIYKKAMDYGLNIEMKDPRDIIDMSNEDIGQIGIYSDGENKYVINKELGETIDNSNGQLMIKGNEILNAKMIQNSDGSWSEEKDKYGNTVYEPTGEYLKPVGEVFKKKEGTMTNEDKFVDDYLKLNLPDDATDTEISSMKNKARIEYRNAVKPTSLKEAETVNAATKLGNSLTKNKYGTTLANTDWTQVGEKDKKTLSEHADIGISLALGKNKAAEFKAKVSSLTSRHDKLLGASNELQNRIDSGENINVLKQTWTQYLSAFFGYSKEEADRVSTNKTVVTEMNNQRHMLYGSVLTAGENRNYTQQASSLFRSNQDLFIATKQMMNDNLDELKSMKAMVGEDLFSMKYGNTLDILQRKVDLLNKVASKPVSKLDRARDVVESEFSSDEKNRFSNTFIKKFKNATQADIDRAWRKYKGI